MCALFAVNASIAACLQGDYSVEAEFKRSVEVVLAKVISERTVPAAPDDPDSVDGTNYAVRVLETFRGQRRKSLTIYSENSSGRFPMQSGRTYILFLYEQQGRLSADYCGNSGLESRKANVVSAVRRLAKVVQGDQKPNNRLKLAARGRSGAESLRRTRAAA